MGKREKKREEPAPWLAAACQVLKGTLAATVLAVGALFTYRNSKSYKEEEAF